MTGSICSSNHMSVSICTSNHMSGRVIWDKLPEYIFENFEISKFSKIRGDLSQKLPEPNM